MSFHREIIIWSVSKQMGKIITEGNLQANYTSSHLVGFSRIGFDYVLILFQFLTQVKLSVKPFSASSLLDSAVHSNLNKLSYPKSNQTKD